MIEMGVPFTFKEIRIMILRQWSAKVAPNSGFQSPDEPPRILEGIVFGHPEVPDGQKAVIAAVKKYDFQEQALRDADDRIVRLRDPDPIYESVHPKASTRIVKVYQPVVR